MSGVVRVPLGPDAHIFPGLINLHDHPFYGLLPLWQAPSSHRQPSAGRPLGTEPYANRYQWNSGPGQPIEGLRLIANPSTIFTAASGLGRLAEVIKFGKARMILGGTTTTQGGRADPAHDTLLARNLESVNFGRQRIVSRVGAIAAISAADEASLVGALTAGLVDAFLVHLAEGVRDGDRRPGDSVSSREEFQILKAKQLLTDATVVLHGMGLERGDFLEMAVAPAARADGAGDSLGAKLVWSPLSNLLLYGKTTAVSEAIAAGVLVSLGTDWTPSGSPNLLTELKVADRVLRAQSAAARPPGGGWAGRGLDQMLVEMVTINPAMAVRWHDQVGSIEAGKTADLLVIGASAATGLPAGSRASPYRRLIDATERDVELVMVGGRPQAGDLAVMSAVKPGDFEVVESAAGCFSKAIDVTDPSLPRGEQTLLDIRALMTDGLRALGGDQSFVGGGPTFPFANTWSYLKARIPGTSALPDSIFNAVLVSTFGSTSDGRLNLEAMAPPPLFSIDDHWWFATLEARRHPATGLTQTADPPYAPYPSNDNHVGIGGNLFAPELFRHRWYSSGC
jgi:hypothetical protein